MDRPLAVVTGAPLGIGYEWAREFVEHGFDVLINFDNPARLAEAHRALALGILLGSA